jgi:hypothetical protein
MECETVRCVDATASSFDVKILGRSLRIFLRSRRIESQKYTELTVWPARANSL